MRYPTLIILISLISGCSFWPFGKQDTGSCLDDDSCDTPTALEQQLLTGATWYCYGVSRDEGWDCSENADESRIVAIADEPQTAEPAPLVAERAEMTFDSETISHQQSAAVPAEPPAQSAPDAPATAEVEIAKTVSDQKSDIFDFSDSAWAVQLIALQTRAEVDAFAAEHALDRPNAVRIRSQGADWFVMILGVYNDRSEADAAAEAWTSRQQPYSKPWVRPLGPLKQAVLEAQSSGD